jgi:hypothetical protein
MYQQENKSKFSSSKDSSSSQESILSAQNNISFGRTVNPQQRNGIGHSYRDRY